MSSNSPDHHSCRLCGHTLSLLLNLGEHPIAHRFLSTTDEEEYTHPVVVMHCVHCGLTQLTDPVPPEELYANYVCLSSWKAQPHAARMVDLVAAMPTITKDSHILEIGSNDGVFLRLLRDRGYRNLLGVEPAADAAAAAQQAGIPTEQTFFGPGCAERLVAEHGAWDLVIARQVLEHIADLPDFVKAIHSALCPAGRVLVEVPNFEMSLNALDYGAIWEEHVNYFTPQTLSSTLACGGIHLDHWETALFSGEALMATGSRASGLVAPGEPPSERANEQAIWFGRMYLRMRSAFHEYLARHTGVGGRVAIYGGGCRACSAINYLGLGRWLTCVLDDQPQKQGRYMPGSRLPILPGDSLTGEGIDLCCLAVNAENEEKVLASRSDYTDAGGRFVSVHPPSPRMPDFWKKVVADDRCAES